MRLATELASIELENVFNPYRHVCEAHDAADAADVRFINLLGYLEGALERRPRTAWIGRDLGYRGGRRTGLPLTDEANLAALSACFGMGSARKATRTGVVAERTAAEIWRVISRIEEPPFLWNAFPFHPYDAGDPLANRCHTRGEFGVCEDIFSTLLDAFEFECIYAIGNDAARALERFGVAFECVRHPSYGGQSTFRNQMASAYRLHAA
ncbi:MAG: uracil-DNA glycosylase [Hyphomicrobiaceae bacterium]|nr:uracil-DNA glycosylase [Hyphomicrobiaceae bacterium]